jgi:acyl carrier protein
MSQTVDQFICTYLQRARSIPGETHDARMQCNFLETGLIDSLGVIDLVMAIESEFKISFRNEDFEDPRFPTVGGLIAIVERYAAAR